MSESGSVRLRLREGFKRLRGQTSEPFWSVREWVGVGDGDGDAERVREGEGE